MREIFHRELEELGDHLLDMARKVSEAVTKAGDAMREADLELAEQVIDADRRVDELEDRIESMSLAMLARQQPVATDLRLVVSALRLSATLERMGDLAGHVAFITRSRYPGSVSAGPMLETLVAMSEVAKELADLLVELMTKHDLALIQRIAAHDDRLDELLDRTFTLLADEDVTLTRAQVVDAVLLSRFLERIGDHCVSGAKRVGYLVTGDLDSSVLLRDNEPDSRKS